MGIPFAYVFAGTPTERAKIRKDLEPLARKYRKNIQFSIADPIDLEDIAIDLHLDTSSLPSFAIREPIANLRYPMNENPSPFGDAINEFIQDYLNGMLQPTIKSEPVPDNSKNTLVKVVGLNYQEIVMDKTKDVLLVFCISPCGPCENFEPTLVLLAELYASSLKLKGRVTIAKVMYDANDTPERGIRAFPTIKLFPAGSKSSSLQFFGNRTLDNLADFIRDNGTNKAVLRDSEGKEVVDKSISSSQKACTYEGDKCVVAENFVKGTVHPELHLEL
jgi:protein disulfide-isomerase A1